MKIKTVLFILKETLYLKGIIKKYGDSLKAGKYHLFDGFRAMALDQKTTRENAFPYFDKPVNDTRKRKIAHILNKTPYFVNTNKRTQGLYEAFYTANNYEKTREVKLFSFENKKILTICTSKEEMQKQAEQFETYGKSFSLPKVVPVEKYENAFEISMVDLKDRPDDIEALKKISGSVVREMSIRKPVNDGKTAKELVQFSYDEKTNEILSKMVSKIDESVLSINIPFCVQHGDLSKDNLIYGTCDGKTDFWYIDWEHAGERIFFYDYFFYIVNSAMYYDKDALNLYIEGKDDKILSEFFAKFGLEFNAQNKKDYFWLFMIVFLKERVCDFSRFAALEMYMSFFEKYPQLL